MGGAALRDRDAMIAGMAPELAAGEFVFRSYRAAPPEEHLVAAIGSFREAEGLSLILPLEKGGEGDALPMRLITLTVHSSLEGVGLAAAVAGALAKADIPCNMVAAYHHDHVFVPAAQAVAALAMLQALAADAAGGAA